MTQSDLFDSLPTGLACHLDKVGACWIAARAHQVFLDGKRASVKTHVWNCLNHELEDGFHLYRLCGTVRCERPDHHVKVRDKTKRGVYEKLRRPEFEKECKRLIEKHVEELRKEPVKDDFMNLPPLTAKIIRRVGECWSYEGFVAPDGARRCIVDKRVGQVDVSLWEYFGYGAVTAGYKLEVICGGVCGCVRPSHNRLRERRETDKEYEQRRIPEILTKCEPVGDCLLSPKYDKVTGYAYEAFRSRTIHMFHRFMYRVYHPGEDISDKEIAHGCRNRNCLSETCLQAKTKHENNYYDKLRDNTLRRAGDHPNALLTDFQAWEAYVTRDLYSIKERAAYYGVSENIIRHIDNLESYTYVTDPANCERYAREAYERREKLKAELGPTTPEHYAATCQRLLEGASTTDRGCVEPDKCVTNRGYVRVVINYEYRIATRVLYEYKRNNCQKLPKKVQVRHMCPTSSANPRPNPGCCNIDHLTIGSAVDNGRDKATEEQKLMALRVMEVMAEYPKSTRKERFEILQQDTSISLKPKTVSALCNIEMGQTFAYITGAQTSKERREIYTKQQLEDYEMKQEKLAKEAAERRDRKAKQKERAAQRQKEQAKKRKLSA